MNKFLRLPPIPTDHPRFKPKAKRPLHQAYILLSVLLILVLADQVFSTGLQAAPVTAPMGVGWYFNDGKSGTTVVSLNSDSPVSSSSVPDQIGFERQLFALINKARADRGLSPLRLNETLTRAARAQAREIAQTRRFDLTDQKGQDPRARVEAAGYTQPLIATEVIGSGAPKPEFALGAWLANSNAAANLLNPEVNEVGIGYVFGKNDPLAHYWTIDLARRNALAFTIVVNHGAESTTNRNVTLNIGGKGWARQMLISNSPDFAGAEWEAYAETKAWTLAEGTGPKRVHVKLRGANYQETQAIGEIALVPVVKGQGNESHADIAVQFAPRAPNLRQLIVQGASGSPGQPDAATIALATAADAFKPSHYQTSEFMLGKVAVGIVFPQCTGAMDRCTETWNAAAMDQVLAQVRSAMNWWAARTNQRVTFVYDLRRQIPTGYEPINHPQSDEGLWMGDTLANMGFPGPNYFEQVYAYNNWMRQQYGTDWAFTIFAANSLASTTGTFSNGYFAYAYVPGPFLVVTYDNGGYGIAKMNAVVAHETGHVFGALDQYTGAGVLCTQTSGYLIAPNQNSDHPGCASNVLSIMRGGSAPYYNNAIDPYALAQIGNRASTGNIPDPINTTPKVTLNPVQSPISNLPISITGIAEDQPYTPPNGDTIDINYITNVQYRVDGGAWQNVTPVGSAQFNQLAQNFSFSPALAGGSHTLEVMATNRVGNTGATGVTVNMPGAPVATATPIPVSPTATRVPPTATAVPPLPTATPLPPTPTRAAPTPIPTAQPPGDRNTIVVAINVGNNAIALPGSAYRASSLLDAINVQGGNAYEVNRWTGRTWQAYNIAGGTEDFAIEPGLGYMVKAKSASAFRVRIDPAQVFQQVQVKKGWDFIGVPTCKDGSQSCYTAASLVAAINADGGGAAEIDRWVNGAWSSYLAGYSQNDFPIIVGQAYYVRSTRAVVWQPD